MILIYAFSNQWGTNISRRTLLELQKLLPKNITYQLVKFHPRSFFNKYFKNNVYNLIIGLGDLYGNFHKIRIETQAKNNYQNEAIYPFSPILIDLNLPPVDNFDSQIFQISSNMGSYNCNYLAYQTQLNLDQRKLSTLHLFLHLPPKSNAHDLAVNIAKLLSDNSILPQ